MLDTIDAHYMALAERWRAAASAVSPRAKLGIYASLAVGALVLVPWQSDAPASRAQRGHVQIEVREVFQFESLAEMTATADVVLVGTVRGSGEGRRFGDADAPIVMTEVAFGVVEVLYGSPVGKTVVVESEPVMFEQVDSRDVPWMRDGATSLLFLERKDDGSSTPYYGPLSRQAIFVVGRDGLLAGAIDDPLVESISALRLSDVRERVAAAVELIRRGQLKAVIPAVPPR
ncbi:MAG: hypothetical protein H0V04_01850 [Chloroflexi bacterium]|nr:hypothetical protein [Chloroflexota bacterium]